MPDPQEAAPPVAAPETTISARPAPRFGRGDLIAAALCVLWLIAVVVWLVTTGDSAAASGGAPGLAMTLLMLILPVAVIWVGMTTLRSVRELRAEAARLQATLEGMRQGLNVQAAIPRPAAQRPAAAPAVAAGGAPSAPPATFATRRDSGREAGRDSGRDVGRPPAPRATADEQPALALGTPAEDLAPPLAVADFIRALQFPESPDDKDGFRAMRCALEDRKVARLIRAAQDVLTLLAQEGIYMDDLTPDRARPEIWRSFAHGERGRAISGLGGIRDRSSLALTAGRMREDPIFRDAAHHFLRTFDRTFAEFEPNASDAELIDLADSRTARAFMLFGRVAGVFD